MISGPDKASPTRKVLSKRNFFSIMLRRSSKLIQRGMCCPYLSSKCLHASPDNAIFSHFISHYPTILCSILCPSERDKLDCLVDLYIPASWQLLWAQSPRLLHRHGHPKRDTHISHKLGCIPLSQRSPRHLAFLGATSPEAGKAYPQPYPSAGESLTTTTIL